MSERKREGKVYMGNFTELQLRAADESREEVKQMYRNAMRSYHDSIVEHYDDMFEKEMAELNIESKDKVRKILISSGYGAGWSTWNDESVRAFMLEYTPIIEALERGEELYEEHPIVLEMVDKIKEKMGEDMHVCVLGVDSLAVVEVGCNDKVRINEYDGAESVVVKGSKEDVWY